MGLYERFVLPRLIDLACKQEPAARQRAKVVPAARGRVLEVGFGSGLNLPFYDAANIERLWALEPSPHILARARGALGRAPFDVEVIESGAESIPLPDGAADTVVITYTLCSIPEPLGALAEIRRVLSPTGALLFNEHGAAPDASVRRWQDRLTPLWSRLGGGCHLNRDAPELLRSAGFRLHDVQSMYVPGWRPASFVTWGRATTG